MPTYKLTYFNVRARGEYSRLLFALAGVEYEDKRVEFADWPALKPTTPCGKLPILEVDGIVLQDSVAIAQYLATEFGLYGSNNIENAKINGAIYIIVDMMDRVYKIKFEKDEAKKDELIKTAKEDIVPTEFKNLSRILGSDTYFFSKKLNLADIFVFHAVDTLKKVLGDDVLKEFPTIVKHHETVSGNSNIAAYLKTRPDSFV